MRYLRIGIIKKKEYNKIKDLTLKGLKNEFKSKIESPSNLKSIKEKIIINKDDYDIKKSSFFKNKVVQEYFNTEDDLFLISKKELLKIIKIYHKNIAKKYNDLVENKEDNFSFLFNKKRTWDNEFFDPYYLEGEDLISVDVDEYKIFELILIYKNINKNELIVLYSW